MEAGAAYGHNNFKFYKALYFQVDEKDETKDVTMYNEYRSYFFTLNMKLIDTLHFQQLLCTQHSIPLFPNY